VIFIPGVVSKIYKTVLLDSNNMVLGNVTPESKKTKFGKVPDYHKARSELSGEDIGELVEDVAEHEGYMYGSAQEVARAFYEENPTKYNKNQMAVRETAKEKVDKHGQPGWAWELLSVYSEDMGKKILDVPSDGSHKGLLIDEDFDNVFLYAKDADGYRQWNISTDGTRMVLMHDPWATNCRQMKWRELRLTWAEVMNLASRS
jgi:hypothetical protein